MEWLNYHHLLYFWSVAREGGLKPAAAKLRLAHPTLSGQIRALEEALGQKLFSREGRRLALTDAGRVAYRYADEIFTLGQELLDTFKDRPTGQPLRLEVGVADTLSKLVVQRLLEPARRLETAVRLVCHEDKPERLMAALSLRELDLALTDAPVTTGTVRTFHHLLGECDIALMAVPALAAAHRPRFPRSLDGAPVVMPLETTSVRRALEQWLAREGLRPRIVGEFEDSALMKVFGAEGLGLFPVPSVVADVVARQYGVEIVGRLPSVRERFYAVSVERRVKHPAVMAILAAAREELFAPGALEE